ncbi:hypothetical protein GCM10020218_064130 [Dactylosporangium vinaceum]
MRATTVLSQPRASRTPVAPLRAQPGVLHGVVGLGLRPEQAVRDRPQVGAVLLELHCHILGLGCVPQ